ncbi:MAG: gliding motility-associated C-terminal domain-containing protein [Owenweeksia sp.]|nr:gliding motility-associated C-terminal domain-containing protein [Owenweeksia sp.]
MFADSAGVYTVKLKVWDPSCVDSLSRQVVIHRTPAARIAPGYYEICARDFIELSSQTIANFSNGDVVDSLVWLLSDGRNFSRYRDSVIEIYFDQSGLYQLYLVAITDKGCIDTTDAPITITVHPRPVISLNEEQTNARSFRLMPEVENASQANYNWSFGNGDHQTMEFLDTIYYRYQNRLCRIDSSVHRQVILEVVNQIAGFGECSHADTLTVEMEGYHLNVPNAFAPDRINVEEANLFLPKGKLLGSYRLRIFDEWGNMIFETTQLDANGSPVVGWDGRHNGRDMPMGGYVWTIDAEFNDGYVWPVPECNPENIKAYGTLNLIR